MPLILTENEATESGIEYKDKTGVSYQFPSMYKKRVRTGERFIYYKGRKKRGGGRIPQVYFGTGIVGDVGPDLSDPKRFVCQILDYRPFPIPVPFKNGAKGYLEVRGKIAGYFQQGVRLVS